jgi:hypothetical protein
MISVVESGYHLRPFTFNDEYIILPDEDTIVDAFLAFVEWAVAFIQEIVDTVFGPIVEAISDLVDSYCSGVQSALKRAEGDVVATGSVSSSSLSMLSSALQGDLYWVLLGLATVIELVLLAITPITITFGFLISVAISLIVTVVVQEALKVDETERWEGELAAETTDEDVMGTILGIEASSGNERDEKMKVAWTIMSGTLGIWSGSIGLRILSFAKAKVVSGLALATSAISTILGFSSISVEDEIIGHALALGSMFAAVSSISISIGDIILHKGLLSMISTSIGLIGLACSYEGMDW